MTSLVDSLGDWALAEALRIEGRLELRARGVSMLPVVWPGARLRLQRVAASEVRLGDVVVVFRSGRAVAHRAVVRDASGRWRTRADASPELDPVEEDERLVARVDGFAVGRGVLRLPAPMDAVLRHLVVRTVPSLARGQRLVRSLLRRRGGAGPVSTRASSSVRAASSASP